MDAQMLGAGSIIITMFEISQHDFCIKMFHQRSLLEVSFSLYIHNYISMVSISCLFHVYTMSISCLYRVYILSISCLIDNHVYIMFKVYNNVLPAGSILAHCRSEKKSDHRQASLYQKRIYQKYFRSREYTQSKILPLCCQL